MYYADIRVWNRRVKDEQILSLPMLLPHELVHKFCKHTCSRHNLFDRGGMDTVPEGHLRIASEQLALDGGVLGIGLWMDGVACE